MKISTKPKKCANCGQNLNGEMLFYPDLCLTCVVEEETNETITDNNRQARGGHA